MDKIQNLYTVVSNKNLCLQFQLLRFEAGPMKGQVEAGQFVHIRVSEGMEPFFRRPFSVYRSGNTIDVFYEAVGPGTQMMSRMKKGDVIDVLGPLGTPFQLPPSNIKQVVMVAGGIGIAPFMMLSDVLKKRKDLELILLYGGRTSGHVYEMKEFKQNSCRVHVATDDGSVGTKGRVSKLFAKIDRNPETTAIYTCGPNPMMKAVQEFAGQHGLRGQAACEEVMACALGACLGCSIRTTGGFKTVCYDGPVFELEEVIFE